MTICCLAQNVGIGTNNPNSSAILDIASTSKGLLLPRVVDTSNVATPAEGLVVYNRAEKAPSYFDGNRWNNVADARNNFVPVDGFIRYTLPGAGTIGGMAVDAGPLPAIDYENAFRVPVIPTGPNQLKGVDSIVLAKEADGNSVIFKRVLLAGNVIPTMEILQYLPGATTPFSSLKLTSIKIVEQSFYISEKTGRLTEKYSLIASVIGYKDWVTGKSFSYNVATKAFGTY